MERAVVVLGAGASYDMWNGLGTRALAYRPPLTAEMFGRYDPRPVDGAGDFDDRVHGALLDTYRGAAAIAQVLAPALASGTVAIERALRTFAEHPSPASRRNFLHVPPYLRDLIHLTTTEHARIPGTHVRLVQELLEDAPHEVLFICLNYDTLLERALTQIDPSLAMYQMSSYVAPERVTKVVKLHGSVNWVVPIGRRGDSDWLETVGTLDLAMLQRQPPHLIADFGTCQVARLLVDGVVNHVYPKLTAPLAGKTTNDVVCPADHLAAVKEFLPTAGKFLFIGTSLLDEDLVQILAEYVLTDVTFVQVVGWAEGADDAMFRLAESNPRFKNAAFKWTFRRGFRAYLNESGHVAFTRPRDYLESWSNVEVATEKGLKAAAARAGTR